MKEKFSILILVFLFFISTTGLPLFSHYCTELGKSVNSDCNDCLTVEQISSSCCIDEISVINEKFVAGKTDCCVIEFDYKKIEDQYSNTQKNNSIPAHINFVMIDGNISDDNETKKPDRNKFNIPPPIYGKELLNTIHQLKLDTPIS